MRFGFLNVDVDLGLITGVKIKTECWSGLAVFGDDLFVDFDAEAGPGGDIQVAFVEGDGVLHELSAEGALGSIELDELGAALEGGEMERSRGEQVRRPGVGNDKAVGAFGHMDDFAADGEAPAAGEVRLKNIDTAAFDKLLEAPIGGFLLAAGDGDADGARDLMIAVVVLGVEEFFDEVGVIRRNGIDEANRFFRGAFDEPAGIDEEVAIGPEGGAGGFDEGDVAAFVLAEAAPAELDGGEALGGVRGDGFGHRRRRGPEKRAGIGGDAAAPFASKEDVDGLAVGLAADIPQRDIEGGDGLERDPASAVIDAAAVHPIPEAFDFQGVFSDEERGQAVEAFHAGFQAPLGGVDASFGDGGAGFDVGVTSEAGVGRDLDEAHVSRAFGFGGGGGIVIQTGRFQDDEFDAGDLHSVVSSAIT